MLTFNGSIDPDDIETLHGKIADIHIWAKINDTIKWARLYGGAIAVLLIDGQDVSKRLNVQSIGKDQFKGLMVLDRWMIRPSLDNLVTEFSPSLGMPKFYTVNQSAPAFVNKAIHHSRVIRIDGYELPHWQKMTENGWGLSIIERLYDRLVAFDSATQGAAQLIYKAHLRTYGVKDLRKVIAAGGKAYEALLTQMDMIRKFQSTEGLTLMDADDEFQAHSYTFAGLSDITLQFGQQLSGAVDIPLVRLFGQSPAGLNSTGESDLRNYYDGINAQQERKLRSPLNTLFDVMHRSVLGRPPEPDFNFRFNPLWQMSETEKAEIATSVTNAVTAAYDGTLVSRETAMKELRQSSDVTGVFSNISDEEIEAAQGDEPPSAAGAINPDGEDFDPEEQEQTEAESETAVVSAERGR